jgi:hypothetical protein
MYQNFNYYPQQQQQSKPINYSYLTQVAQPAGLKGRPVSSIEEAKA